MSKGDPSPPSCLLGLFSEFSGEQKQSHRAEMIPSVRAFRSPRRLGWALRLRSMEGVVGGTSIVVEQSWAKGAGGVEAKQMLENRGRFRWRILLSGMHSDIWKTEDFERKSRFVPSSHLALTALVCVRLHVLLRPLNQNGYEDWPIK